jgi:hypothetical protein
MNSLTCNPCSDLHLIKPISFDEEEVVQLEIQNAPYVTSEEAFKYSEFVSEAALDALFSYVWGEEDKDFESLKTKISSLVVDFLLNSYAKKYIQ